MPKTVLIEVQAKLAWQCFRAKGGHWIGVSDPLGLTVQAETWAELMEDIGHTLDAMLKDLMASNELDAFMRDHGWHALGPIPSRPKDVTFDVPFIPALVAGDGSQRDLHQ